METEKEIKEKQTFKSSVPFDFPEPKSMMHNTMCTSSGHNRGFYPQALETKKIFRCLCAYDNQLQYYSNTATGCRMHIGT
jgi:hypothetical protein